MLIVFVTSVQLEMCIRDRPVSLPVSDLESLASASFFSDFAYVRVVSSLFEAASTVVAQMCIRDRMQPAARITSA